MILYNPEEIKKIMEDNFEKSMDLPAFYHNLLVAFGLPTLQYPLEPKDCYVGGSFRVYEHDEVGQFNPPKAASGKTVMKENNNNEKRNKGKG